jgi:hypothetical protein
MAAAAVRFHIAYPEAHSPASVPAQYPILAQYAIMKFTWPMLHP